MTPIQVTEVLRNISGSLTTNGELLITFKDAPTKQQMHELKMAKWADEVFTADTAASVTSYLQDGYLRAVMWDDDY